MYKNYNNYKNYLLVICCRSNVVTSARLYIQNTYFYFQLIFILIIGVNIISAALIIYAHPRTYYICFSCVFPIKFIIIIY